MAALRPLLVTTERKSLLPILIIDKSGILGSILAKKLYGQFLVVLVTPTVLDELAHEKTIIHVPYRKRIPLIPNDLYSHVFLFYNGEEELLDMLPSFMKKANESAGKLFLVSSLFFSSKEFLQTLELPSYHHLKLLFYGELFDNNLQEENLINYFIFQARSSGRIEVPRDANTRVYPVHSEDVLSALIAVAFSEQPTKRILFAFPKHEITALSVARIMQKIEPSLKVDYRKYRKKQPLYYIPQGGEYCFPDYNVELRLRDITFSQDTEKELLSKGNNIIRYKKKRFKNPYLIFGLLVVYLILFPLVLLGLFTATGLLTLGIAAKEAEAFHFSSARSYLSYANFSFTSATLLTNTFSYADVLVKSPRQALLQQLSIDTSITDVATDIFTSADTIKNVLDGKSSQPKDDFSEAIITIKNALLQLQKLDAEGSLPAQISSKLSNYNDIISLFENTSDAYPTLAGFSGKKKYLVLFENNMELRPGGGFIGSYGIGTLDNGKPSLQIQDVYDADGKLTTHVEPPFALRRYLGVAHLFLRDSNFDVDFTNNAATASKMLKLETGDTVDGVIAIDTTVLQQLLKAFGQVRVPDYNEVVTPDNFYLLTQNHAEKDFFPGSSQKKDFLRALSSAMLTQFGQDKQFSYQQLLNGMMQSLKEKHILLAFADKGIQDLFTVNNLSGSLWDGRNRGDNDALDYIGVVDANLGTNKVNYYLNRSIDQEATMLDSGDVAETVTVTYQNISTKDSPYGGDYKNYVRFLLPKEALLTSVAFDGVAVQTTDAITDPAVFTQPDFTPPQQLEVEESLSNDKQVVGFLTIVPAGTKKTVAISYTVPHAVSLDKPNFSYKLRVVKQPGTLADPYTFNLVYPTSYQFFANKQDDIVDLGDKLRYQTNLTNDKDVTIQFTKK